MTGSGPFEELLRRIFDGVAASGREASDAVARRLGVMSSEARRAARDFADADTRGADEMRRLGDGSAESGPDRFPQSDPVARSDLDEQTPMRGGAASQTPDVAARLIDDVHRLANSTEWEQTKSSAVGLEARVRGLLDARPAISSTNPAHDRAMAYLAEATRKIDENQAILQRLDETKTILIAEHDLQDPRWRRGPDFEPREHPELIDPISGMMDLSRFTNEEAEMRVDGLRPADERIGDMLSTLETRASIADELAEAENARAQALASLSGIHGQPVSAQDWLRLLPTRVPRSR